MEWSDRMKRCHGPRITWEPFVVFGGIVVLVLILAWMFMPNDVEADIQPQMTSFQNRLIQAEEKQAKSLKTIADELTRIRKHLKGQ